MWIPSAPWSRTRSLTTQQDYLKTGNFQQSKEALQPFHIELLQVVFEGGGSRRVVESADLSYRRRQIIRWEQWLPPTVNSCLSECIKAADVQLPPILNSLKPIWLNDPKTIEKPLKPMVWGLKIIKWWWLSDPKTIVNYWKQWSLGWETLNGDGQGVAKPSKNHWNQWSGGWK